MISLVSDISQWEEPLAKPMPYAAFTRGTTGSQPLLHYASDALGKLQPANREYPTQRPNHEAADVGRWPSGYFGGVGLLVAGVGLLVAGVGLLAAGVGLLAGGLSLCLVSRFS